MTVRPLDLGPQFPSDTAAPVPADPTAGIGERDYVVKRLVGRGVAARREVKASPDVRAKKDNTPPRQTFSGVVVKRESGKRYIVLRQDGRRLSATIYGDDIVYDSLRVGENVTVIEGQVPNQWFITGRTRRNEMESLTVGIGAEVSVIGTEKEIPFTLVIRQTGDTEEPAFTSGEDGILIEKDIQGEYEVSIDAHVTNQSSCTKQYITVLMDVRISDDKSSLQFKQGIIEVDELNPPPSWVNKIPLASCGGY